MKSSISTLLVAAAVMLFSTSQVQAQLNVLWGAGSGDATQEADGQFDGGLNNWTAVSLFDGNNTTGGNALWVYSADGSSQGAYYNPATSVGLTSPSAANGAALFDSDFMDNGGNAGQFGSGVSPSPHSGALVSPTIDLTGTTQALVRFNSYYRRFTPTSVFVGVTTDGGATWTDFDAIESVPAVNAAAANTTQYVDISDALTGAASLANVQIRFLFDGDYYFWTVDDVSIVEKPPFNIALEGPRDGSTLGDAFTTAYASSSYHTPLGQVDAQLFGFGARIINLGSANESGAYIVFNVDYEDNNGNVVTSDFRDSVVFDLLPGADTIITIPGTYEPSVPGVYTATYEVVSSGTEEAELLYNNTEVQTFVINEQDQQENYVSRVPVAADGGPASTRSLIAAEGPNETLTDFEYGSMFYIRNAEVNDTVRILDSVYYRPVNTNTNNTPSMTGQVVTVILYEWVDVDGDGGIPTDHSAAIGTELIIAAVGSDTLPAGIQDGDLRRLKLTDAGIPPAPEVLLKDTSIYLLTVRNSNANGVFVGVRANDNFNYSLNVQTNANDGLDIWPAPTRIRFTDAQGNPSNPNAPQGTWNNVGYGADVVPSIMMKLNDAVAPVSTQEIRPTLTNVKLFPNPTSNVVNVEYAGEAEEVTYTVIDLNGRVLSSEIRTNVADDVYTYDVSALPAGMYLMNVTSEKGARTISFVVGK